MSRTPALASIISACAVLALGGPLTAQAPDPQAAAARVATLKQTLQDDQARLRTYEWTETTSINLKGEEKARKQNRVYYGADGTLTKQPIGNAPQAAAQGGGGAGRRGGRVKERIIENKKDEMQEYMEKAGNLIKTYVPPTPGQIQAARDAGKVSIAPAGSGRVRIAFKDYVQPGDSMTIDIDGANNRLVTLNVASYLEKKEDVVTLGVEFGALTDGTGYARQTTLEAKAKEIKVVVENSSHRLLAR